MVNLENKLKKLILKNVAFKIDNKIVKRGKIKIFNTKQFFIRFKLINTDGERDYELPYPFRIEVKDTHMLFDYSLSAFIPNTEEVYWKMKTMNYDKCSKLYDNYLLIVPLSS